MDEGHYYVPAGAPPGLSLMHSDARPPDGVYYFRIYAGIMAFSYACLAIFGLVTMVSPLFAGPASATSSADMDQWFVGFFCVGIGTALCTAFLVALFGGRRSWVHTMGTLLIGLGMMSGCCLPLTIPLLIQWLKPETKQWYTS
jgi:hypothetical protein